MSEEELIKEHPGLKKDISLRSMHSPQKWPAPVRNIVDMRILLDQNLSPKLIRNPASVIPVLETLCEHTFVGSIRSIHSC